MAAVAEAVREPRAASAAIAGTVRVGVTYTVADYFLHAITPVSPATFRMCRSISTKRRAMSSNEHCLMGAMHIAVILVSNLGARESLQSETLIRSWRRLWLPVEHALMK
jgi:hypothetical protein